MHAHILEQRQYLYLQEQLFQRHPVYLRYRLLQQLVVVSVRGVQMHADAWHHTASAAFTLLGVSSGHPH